LAERSNEEHAGKCVSHLKQVTHLGADEKPSTNHRGRG
jgi:hypothetical protein